MNKLREKALIDIIDELIWMSARYSNGRHTYAPSMVRDAVQKMKTMYPLWTIREDKTMHPPTPEDLAGMVRKEDYLWDIFNPNNK